MTGKKFMIGTLAALALGLSRAGQIAAAVKPTPWVGTWVLDVAKSTFTPGPPLKSEALVIGETADGRVQETMDYVSGDGKATHLAFDAAFDGKPVAVIGGANIDSVTLTPSNGIGFKIEFKKGDALVTWGFLEIDKEGETLHGPMYGVAPDGSRWRHHYVFERRRVKDTI